MISLAHQRAIVTGGGGGIGSAICRALARHCADVWAVGRTATALSATVDRCNGRAKACVADLEDPAQLLHLTQRAGREWGQLDILVHAAGTIAQGAVADAPVEAFDAQYRSNVRLHYCVTQRLLPLLRKAPGQIVFINSSVARGGPRSNVSQYAATQHAARAFADTLRQEVNADGIRVICVYPGRTATPLQERLYAADGETYRPELLIQPDDIAEMVTAALALPATAEVTDICMRPMAKSY